MKKWVYIVLGVFLLMASTETFAVEKSDVSVASAAKGGTKLLQQFNSVESLVGNAGKLQRLKGGVRQGFVQGNADDIFKGLSQQYGSKIQVTPKGNPFFTSGNLRVDLTGSSRGFPTLRINNAGSIFKIRTQ